jgi:hypothetical protein
VDTGLIFGHYALPWPCVGERTDIAMGWVARALRRSDAKNQAVLDALAGRVVLDGPGVVFITAPHFDDGEWSEWAPWVSVDGGDRRRLHFGKVFVMTAAGRRHLLVENGAPRLWRRAGIELIVEVPADGQVTLLVKGDLFRNQLPSVVPAPECTNSVWVKEPHLTVE